MNDDNDSIEEDPEEDEENSEMINMDILLKYLTQVHSNENDQFEMDLPGSLNLKNLKDIKNGDIKISKKDVMKNIRDKEESCIIEIEESTANESNNQINDVESEYPILTKEKLVQLICQNKKRKVQDENNNACRVKADGSCRSIIKWSKQNKIQKSIDNNGNVKETKICMDKNQRRAFQLITAKFVLSYYNEVEKMDISINNGDIDRSFKKNKLGLKILTDNIQHLLMFFSGAGGSGKSEVIKQVLLYCKLFCKNIIVRFDASTIRITALTGVAATAINGETIDFVAGLQTKEDKTFSAKDIEQWKNTRILMVDEISFMSCKN